MARKIYVRFPADRPRDYYTRVFYFAEALWGPIVDSALGTLHDIEHAREIIRIDVSASRHVGDVKVIIKKALGQHNLLDDATITAERSRARSSRTRGPTEAASALAAGRWT